MSNFIYVYLPQSPSVADSDSRLSDAFLQMVQITDRIVRQTAAESTTYCECSSPLLGFLGLIPSSDIVKLHPRQTIGGQFYLSDSEKKLVENRVASYRAGRVKLSDYGETSTRRHPVIDIPADDPRPADINRAKEFKSPVYKVQKNLRPSGGASEALAANRARDYSRGQALSKRATRHKHRKPRLIPSDIAAIHWNLKINTQMRALDDLFSCGLAPSLNTPSLNTPKTPPKPEYIPPNIEREMEEIKFLLEEF